MLLTFLLLREIAAPTSETRIENPQSSFFVKKGRLF